MIGGASGCRRWASPTSPSSWSVFYDKGHSLLDFALDPGAAVPNTSHRAIKVPLSSFNLDAPLEDGRTRPVKATCGARPSSLGLFPETLAHLLELGQRTVDWAFA